MKDPLGLADRSVYLPDLSEEELQRRIAEDERRNAINAEIAAERIARLLNKKEPPRRTLYSAWS